MEEEVLFKVELNQGGAFANLERFKKGIIETKQEQAQLNKAFKEGNVTLDEYVAESVRLEQVLKKETQAYNQLTKQVQGHESQTEKLIKSNKELVASNQKISGGFQSMAGNINVAGTNLGSLTSGMTAFLNPVTAAGAAVGALATAYFNTGRGAQDLEAIQFKLQATTEVLSNKVADLVDKFKDPESTIGKFTKALIDTNPVIQSLRLQWNFFFGETQEEIDKLADLKGIMDDIDQQMSDAITKRNNLLEDNAGLLAEINESETSYADKVVKLEQAQTNINEAYKDSIGLKKLQVALLQEELKTNVNSEAIQRQIDSIEKEISQEQRQRAKQLATIEKLTDNIQTAEQKRLEAVTKTEEKERLILEHKNAQIDTEDNGVVEQGAIQEAVFTGNEQITSSLLNMTLQTDQLTAAIQKKNIENEKGIKTSNAAIKSDKDRATGLMILGSALGGVATLFKENTVANKVFSAAQAAINSFLAGTQVLRDPTLPTFAKIPAMIAVIGAGIAQQAKILGAFADGGLIQGFAGGGALSGTRINASHGRPIRRSNGDNLLATVKTGEVILKERQQAALGGSRTFRAIGVPGFETGGITGPTATTIARSSESRTASNDLFKAISKMKFAVSVEDINEGQQRVEVIESMSTF